MMMIVFLKSTVLPCPSVNLPSSSTWSRILNTSGCAFSISSSSTTEYPFLLTASVNCPHSSYPTSPGSAPISLDTDCFSIYSDISILTNAFLSKKRNAANALASSVFPTPVGPRKMNDQVGFFGSLSPILARLIALLTAAIASSCPITLEARYASRFASFSDSSSLIFANGIPVILEITCAISSLSTVSLIVIHDVD